MTPSGRRRKLVSFQLGRAYAHPSVAACSSATSASSSSREGPSASGASVGSSPAIGEASGASGSRAKDTRDQVTMVSGSSSSATFMVSTLTFRPPSVVKVASEMISSGHSSESALRTSSKRSRCRAPSSWAVPEGVFATMPSGMSWTTISFCPMSSRSARTSAPSG